MEDSSDQDAKSTVPKEIEGWNWGAFFLNGFWGLGNKTYIALLAFVPFINVIVMFILGFRGNKMAWLNKEWESVEHFKAVQAKWNFAGMVAFTIYVIIFLINFWDIL